MHRLWLVGIHDQAASISFFARFHLSVISNRDMSVVKISVKAFFMRRVETRITSFTKDIDELYGRNLGGAMANYLAETHTDAFLQTMVEKEADGIMESLNESDNVMAKQQSGQSSFLYLSF
jgi:hypothetical protein